METHELSAVLTWASRRRLFQAAGSQITGFLGVSRTSPRPWNGSSQVTLGWGATRNPRGGEGQGNESWYLDWDVTSKPNLSRCLMRLDSNDKEDFRGNNNDGAFVYSSPGKTTKNNIWSTSVGCPAELETLSAAILRKPLAHKPSLASIGCQAYGRPSVLKIRVYGARPQRWLL